MIALQKGYEETDRENRNYSQTILYFIYFLANGKNEIILINFNQIITFSYGMDNPTYGYTANQNCFSHEMFVS